MILPMIRARILGPREELDDVLAAVQDVGLLQLSESRPSGVLRPVESHEREAREARRLRGLLRDVDALATRFDAPPVNAPAPPSTSFAAWLRQFRRARRAMDRIEARRRTLEEERTGTARLLEFIRAFRGLLPTGSGTRTHGYHLVLRGQDAGIVARLREALAQAIGDEFVLETAPLLTGELAAVLLVPPTDAARVERLLAQAGVHELPMPEGSGGRTLGQLGPTLAARRDAIDAEMEALDRERQALAVDVAPQLRGARAAVEDRLLGLAAREMVAATPRSFVVEGWLPAAGFPKLTQALAARFGGRVVVESVAREDWEGESAPVVLQNPRLFRPFETITRMVPLPAYGTIDPTPFVAVFFPMFFGLIMGDIGYGILLALVALWLRHGGAPGSTRRAVAEVLGAGAAFSVAFGIAFGEFFGDLGARWFGLRPILLDREHSLLAFLGLAIAIGAVHIVLGLALGVFNASRGHPRQAVGKGASLVMVLLIVVVLLVAIEVLPHGFLTPAIIGLLVLFPVLVLAEGIIAPIEFLSTLSNILSYARIMALGTASVMMAVVANELAGSVGSVLVGVLFALLFHLVNFALAIFAPTIHGLRLHYVEFFGKFHSPGGQAYRPFAHWRPSGHAS
ncbi:MAG: V-type ATPase 116kDa subunit family protein [Gemmatimonadales bacterium]